jgi:hypothetical protein
MPALPVISHLPEPIRVLMTLGFALLLVLLRFDAERFGAAEYDDLDKWGKPPSLTRRISWYVIGIAGLLLALMIHPSPGDLYLGLGDRLGALILGGAFGAIGATVAVVIAMYRYGTVRLPDTKTYPGAVVNALATAIVDEGVFRGLVFGFLIVWGVDPTLANLLQALLYALATRLGAPGRPWYMLVTALAVGLAGGWVTATTGGIGAAFLGHSITRVAIFLMTGHSGLPKARGAEAEEVEYRRRTPDGWRVLPPRDVTPHDG